MQVVLHVHVCLFLGRQTSCALGHDQPVLLPPPPPLLLLLLLLLLLSGP
jgi:hypothetical protein